MQFERDFARRFRESADALRGYATGDATVVESGILGRIAAEYERTAAELESLDRANPDPDAQPVNPSGAAIAA